MSRVYNVLTGPARSISPVTIETPDDGVWSNDEETPFVEIGGPAGPVYSPAKPTPHTEVATPVPTGDASREFPRLVAANELPAYLSVRFHDAAVPAPVVAPGGGPDATLVAYHHPDHAISGEYRTLRDEISKQLPETTSQVLFFTAAFPEAGTTTVMLNLALTLAAKPKARVLVIDSNLARPTIATKLALKLAPGLCEVLAQQVPLTWAVQPSVVPQLHVLSAGAATETAASTISRDLPRLLSQLRQWYDWVLVDSGVWGVMPERDATCPAGDAVYLVTRDGDTGKSEFLGLRGWVKELGGLLRGYVATRG